MTNTASRELKIALSTLRKFKRMSQTALVSKQSLYQANNFIETVYTDSVHALNEIEELIDKNKGIGES